MSGWGNAELNKMNLLSVLCNEEEMTFVYGFHEVIIASLSNRHSCFKSDVKYQWYDTIDHIFGSRGNKMNLKKKWILEWNPLIFLFSILRYMYHKYHYTALYSHTWTITLVIAQAWGYQTETHLPISNLINDNKIITRVWGSLT